MLDQAIVFATLFAALVLFVWGRPRYDIVAVLSLLAVVVAGIVPAKDAFNGMGHPAVITVAAVLVISQDLEEIFSISDGTTTVNFEFENGYSMQLPDPQTDATAFLDGEGRAAVLDFSAELVVRHPGGSAAESATLTSILRTVALNFPGTRRCVILVEGAQVETLAGHLDMIKPFDPRRWL